MGILESVEDFRGLKQLPDKDIPQLCAELRKKIISVTLANGGHLGASLGAVELTVALLRAFDPDRDKIIFDVGHQSYAYKILTKRLDSFDTLRTKGGIAGFPRIGESEYDFFTTGHSSTSISAAMGYAKARDLKGEDHNVVALIGDGALLNGVAFEALNNIAQSKSKIIIVLNDNKMSISPRIGGMAEHLASLAVNPTYKRLKSFIKEQCRTGKRGSAVEEALARAKTKLKSLLLPTNIFEELDISYWGPFDGHNTRAVEDVMNLAKSYDRSLLIHVITQKGRGCAQAEADPCTYHGISPNTKLEVSAGEKSGAPSWSSVMAQTIESLAEKDDRIVACTAAMTDGTKLTRFAKKFPKRFFDVGIAEEHMLVYAAGLAAGGMLPAVCVYSTFLQRAIDQIMHDICLSKLPVLIGVDRAGFVGEDGETHHGLFDLPWIKSLPEMTFAAPRDAVDLEFFVMEWARREIPMAIRYPRGTATISLSGSSEERKIAPWGRAEILSSGEHLCLLGVGNTTELMLDVARKISDAGLERPTVVDLRFIKPLDFETIEELLSSHELMITAEEGALIGGVGESIAARALTLKSQCRVLSVGAPDRYIGHATRAEQWIECGLTAENILRLSAENEN